MSESKTNNKQKSPWPWVTGIIALAGFIWFMLIFVYIPENRANAVKPGDIGYSKSFYNPPLDTVNEVKEFINYVDNSNSKLSERNYSEKGLIKLQSAISYIADRADSTDYNVKENTGLLDRDVARIDTSSVFYLNELKPAFSDAVNALGSIQKINYPHLAGEIYNLRNVEKSINVRKSMRSQFHKIKHFYKETVHLLHQMKLSYAFSLNAKGY